MIQCEFEVIRRIEASVTVTTRQEYVRERDRTLGTEGARVGADAVLIPEDRREPDRDNAELEFDVSGGVPQPTEHPIAGDAIHYVPGSCASGVV